MSTSQDPMNDSERKGEERYHWRLSSRETRFAITHQTGLSNAEWHSLDGRLHKGRLYALSRWIPIWTATPDKHVFSCSYTLLSMLPHTLSPCGWPIDAAIALRTARMICSGPGQTKEQAHQIHEPSTQHPFDLSPPLLPPPHPPHLHHPPQPQTP